jgi:hypothetical protein
VSRPRGLGKLHALARLEICDWYLQRRTHYVGFLIGPDRTFGALREAFTLHDVARIYAVSDQAIDAVISRHKRLGDLPAGRLPRASRKLGRLT